MKLENLARLRRYRLTKARSPDYKTLQDLRPDTSRRPQEGLAAYLKEVELAAGMQTEQATAPSRDASTPSS